MFNKGRVGEKMAEKYLLGKNFHILESNFRIFSKKQLGEIDIVAEKNSAIYFFEVKTRFIKNNATVFPEEAITREKLRKINNTAQIYIKKNKLFNQNYFISAITVLIDEKNGVAKIRLIENIFY